MDNSTRYCLPTIRHFNNELTAKLIRASVCLLVLLLVHGPGNAQDSESVFNLTGTGKAVIPIAVEASTDRIRLNSSTATVAEGGTVTVTMERVGSGVGKVSVEMRSRNITATAPDDYSSTSRVFTWESGETGSRFVRTRIRADDITDPNEQFSVGIYVAPGAPPHSTLRNIGTPSVQTITITEPTPPAAGKLQFSKDAVSVAENAKSVAVTVQRVGGSAGRLTARLSTSNGSATAGADYTSIDQQLVWEDGSTTAKTVNIPILNDSLSEPTEQFSVALAGTPASVIGSPSTQTVSITNVVPLPVGKLQFSKSVVPVSENAGSVAINVQRVGGSAGRLSARLTTKNGSAIAGEDYTSVSQELVWEPGITASQTINIPVLKDTSTETTEQFTVNLAATANTPSSAIGSPSSATVSISDVPPPQPIGKLQFSKASVGVAEDGKSLAVSIQRVGGSSGPLSARVSTKNGSAIAGADYTSFNKVLSWAAGNTAAQTINIPILNDTLDEPTEQFTVNLTAAGQTPVSAIGPPATQTVSITDVKMQPAGTLQFSKATATVGENAGSLTVTIQRVNGTAGQLTAGISTKGGTATINTDFTNVAANFLWKAGDATPRTFKIPILKDSITEPVEKFTVELLATSPTPAGAIGSPSTQTVSITDIPPPLPVGKLRFSAATATVAEDKQTVAITVQRAGGSSGPLSASVTTKNGSATAGADYTSFNKVLSWAAGNASPQTINIPILNDSSKESTEQFTVDLAATGNTPDSAIASPSTQTISITDVTPDPAGTIRFSKDAASVAENDGSVAVLMQRQGGSRGPISVQIATQDGSAKAGADYTAVSQTVSWADGETAAKSVPIKILQDTLKEPDERFSVKLSVASEGDSNFLGTPSVMSISIADIAPPPAGSLQFSQSSDSINEDAGNIELIVQRVGGSAGELSASVSTTDGTAINGQDYTGLATPRTLTWKAGQTTAQTVRIPITNDGIDEAQEQFTAQLKPVAGALAGTISAPDTIAVTINNVQPPASGTIRFSNASQRVSEDAGSVSVTVERTGGQAGALSVNVASADGSAVNGSDYTGLAQAVVLTWADNDTSPKQINIPILDNSEIENDETFTLNLTAANASILSKPDSHTVTISDAANAGTFSFSVNTITTEESNGAIDITVSRNNGSDGAVSVGYATEPDTATAGQDFTTTTGTLSWQDGETTAKTFQVPINADTIDETEEQFLVTLGNAKPFGDNVQLGNPATLVVSIAQNSAAVPGTVSFSSAVATAPESNASAELVVTRSGGSSGALSVRVVTADDTATAGSDYSALDTVLTWADGETGDKPVSVALVDDATFEQDEMFSARLVSDNPALIGSVGTVVVTIENDDEAPVTPINAGTIRLLTSSLTVNENAGVVLVSAERVGGSDGAVSVDLIVSGISAEAGTDFTVPSLRLNWLSGVDGIQSIEIPIVRDQLIEQDESFRVSLKAVTTDVAIDPQANEATVIIKDTAPQSDSSYALTILSGDEQQAVPGDTLAPMVISVGSSNDASQSLPAVSVRWRVEPAGAARLLDGEVTLSDANGSSSNRVEVLANGFIYIIATALGTTEETAAAATISRVDPAPPNLVQGQAAFLIRAGLEATPGLNLNQSRTAEALDNVCATLGNAQDANEALTPAQTDLLQTCGVLDTGDAVAENIQGLAPEELFAIADSIVGTTNIQVTNIYSRINSIRSGQTDRFDLANLQLQIYDQVIPGSVLDAAQNAISQNPTDADDSALSDGLFSRFGFFVNGSLSSGEVDGDGIQQDADVSTRGITFGADYRLNDTFVVGAGVGMVRNDTNFTQTRGGSTVDGASLSLFGTWYEGDKGYVDLVFDIGRNSYDLDREISLNGGATSLIASGETDATILALSLSAGRNFSKNGYEFGPYVRMALISATVDAYDERVDQNRPGFGAALSIQSHKVKSTSFTIGGQLSKSVSTNFGVLLPQLRVEFESENELRKNGITATFLADPNDAAFTVSGTARDDSYLNLGIGSSLLLKNGKTGFLFYETRAQQDFVTQHWLKLGFRMTF